MHMSPHACEIANFLSGVPGLNTFEKGCKYFCLRNRSIQGLSLASNVLFVPN